MSVGGISSRLDVDYPARLVSAAAFAYPILAWMPPSPGSAHLRLLTPSGDWGKIVSVESAAVRGFERAWGDTGIDFNFFLLSLIVFARFFLT